MGFLKILQENYQIQTAAFYNIDKTDEDKAKRNAVIEEYKDLIAIYKCNNVPLTCMYCNEQFEGKEPEICCNSSDCGCMGMPIDPVVCSKGCCEMFINSVKPPLVAKWLAKPKKAMKKYIISPITTYCEEEKLYATKLGIEGKHMPLHYTVWGNTEAQSRSRAEELAEIMTNYRSSSYVATHHN